MSLRNDAKAFQGDREGIYHYRGSVNQMDYFIDTQEVNAIWYKPSSDGTGVYWLAGIVADIDSYTVGLYSYSSDPVMVLKCPNNEGHVWDWNYSTGSDWVPSSDISVKCVAENDFCTSDDPCGLHEGDCDINEECLNGFACGSNNCQPGLGYSYDTDCCKDVSVSNSTNFLLKVCCSALNITTGIYSILDGNYTSGTGFVNEMDYYVSPTGEYALWHVISGFTYLWVLGPIAEIGGLNVYMYTSVAEKKCPNNEGYMLDWNSWDGSSWIAANDVYIKCANEDDFCTSANPCGLHQGDCDVHAECQTGLECGSNNCPDSLGFDADEDCCVAVSSNSRKTNFEVASPIMPTGNFPIGKEVEQ